MRWQTLLGFVLMAFVDYKFEGARFRSHIAHNYCQRRATCSRAGVEAMARRIVEGLPKLRANHLAFQRAQDFRQSLDKSSAVDWPLI